MLNCVKRGYKAWRVYDSSLIVLNKHHHCPAKVSVSPLQLIRVFGPPLQSDEIEGTSGTYDFEDQNLDLFKVIDRFECKEFLNVNHLKKQHPPYKIRGKTPPFPSIEEFWNSEDVYDFWVLHSHYADLSSFLEWFKEKLRANEDLKQKLIEQYGEIETYDNYHKNYEIEREYALFKYYKKDWDN